MNPINVVRVVTREHGETFTKALARCDVLDAFDATKIMSWPDEGIEAQFHFNDLVDEIIERTFLAAAPAIRDAFVSSANAVLARERRRRTVVPTR